MATQTHIWHLIGHTVFPAAGVNINDRGIAQAEKDGFTDMIKSKGLWTKERIWWEYDESLDYSGCGGKYSV